jgi:LmbE family N-acetylglucosaminyl deacetylase
MRWIYISPHLDDAALSAGGLIHEQTRAGELVEIWTIMCGVPPTADLSPFAQALHQQWGMDTADEVVRGRRQEDANAAGILGAQPRHFDYLDCIYRQGKSGDWLYRGIFVPPHDEEADLPAQIAESISARLTSDDQLVCPLGIGSHVDHVLVRRAVDLLQRPTLYYADIPYLLSAPEELAPITAGMKGTAHRVDEAGLRSWQGAIAAYTSQVPMLFDSPEKMREKIHGYWAENGGICLWEPI